MTKQTRPRAAALAAATSLWLTAAAGVPAQEAPVVDATPPTSKEVLAGAFANRYEIDWVSRIELVMRNSSGQERRRLFHAAAKMIDGRVRSVGRLMSPEYLRGMTILTIENLDRGHDAFVFLPSLGKVRRITTAQRGDAFFGTDVTYEDLERRRVEEFDLGDLVGADLDGEPVFRIRARPLENFSYAEVEFVVSQTDGAILETRYFKQRAPTPYRVITSPRASMIRRDGHVVPTRFSVRDEIRGTRTDVEFTDLVVNPPIDDRLFSVSTLESGRDLPDPAAMTAH